MYLNKYKKKLQVIYQNKYFVYNKNVLQKEIIYGK